MSEACVSVVICTRNRPDGLLFTVRSVLASDHRNIEIVVVDQSDDGHRPPLSDALLDPAVRHFYSSHVGLSRARNDGLQVARYELVVMTEDDCQVAPDFVSAIVRALETSSATLVFGDVLAPTTSDVGTMTPVRADAHVVHYGSRTLAEARVLTRSSMLGVGAVCGKLLRAREPSVLVYLREVVWHAIVLPRLEEVVHLRRPPCSVAPSPWCVDSERASGSRLGPRAGTSSMP